MTPVRIQRSRRKGSKLVSPNGLPVVCVTRGTKWGNPFQTAFGLTPEDCVALYAKWMAGEIEEGDELTMPRGNVVALPERPSPEELRGCNLACWCKCEPCHADVLLELANAPVPSLEALP